MVLRNLLNSFRPTRPTLPCRVCHAQRQFVSVSEGDETEMYCRQCGTVLRVVQDLDDDTEEYLRKSGERY